MRISDFLTVVIVMISSCEQEEVMDTSNIISGDSLSCSSTSQHSLDSIYQSGFHTDTSLAVFKSKADQKKLYDAYMAFLQDFGKFLKANQFVWKQETKLWNRIYFDKEGRVEYYVYDFKTDIDPKMEKRYKNIF